MANHRKEEMESRLSLYLHTAAEIVTQVGAILDPEAFLSAAVTLLKERFDLYHVHVYTLDEGAGDLVMRAGYGEAGRVMKEQGHKIPLSREQSLVAQAARTREIVTVGDVTKDPEFLPNPLLPDTKSEVAIPLVVGERVLGVFDIQDDTLDRFSSVELDVFRTLSGQLAVTLQNAQLFAERKQTEEALKRERRLFVGGPVVVFRWVNAEGWPVEYASPNLESFIGYSAEDLMNGVVPYASLVYPDDLMHVAEEVAGYTKEGRASFEQEYRMVKANGDVIWIYDFTTIVRNERGQATHYDGYIMDITERKRAEEVLEKRLVAMTKPLDDVSGITFEDLFNLADIQRLQDEFADATGVASIITHPDGTPITRPSRFCHFCNDIVRKTGKGLANCYRSDAALGRLSPDGPTIQPCMSGGLWDAGAGISVGGRQIANWLIGQVRDETQTEEKMRAYAREIEADEETLVEAFRDVPAMSYERFQQISQALFTLANQLSNSAYQNIQQARFIEEHKQAEVQVREIQQRLQTLVSNLPGMVYRLLNKPGFPAQFISEGSLALTGYSPEELMTGTTYEELAYPEDRDRVWATMGEALEKHERYQVIYRIRTAKGETKWVWEQGSGIFDEAGNLVAVDGFVADISEQRQAQDNLRTIFNSVYDAVFIHGVDGSILDVNDKLLELYGVTREQAPKFSIAEDYSSPENPLDELPVTWQKVLAGEPQYFGWKARRPNDGTTFDAEVFLRKITMGDKDVVMANIRDVSDRKQAEAERVRFTERLAVAADIATQVNTILDPDELLETVIPLIKERFGLYYVHVYTVDEAEGVLKLRAGYGEPGRIMVERGHHILLDAEKSLVARAARTQEMVLVDDVREDPEFLPNPLLPDTKSEVAVPAIAGGKVLGVFDVQHDIAGYFTEADLDVFRTLAGQIATAFQNAQLFAERKRAEEAVQVQQAFLGRVINASPDLIFVKDYDSKYVLANQALAGLYGTTPEEMIGKTDADFSPTETEVAFFQAQDRKVIDSQQEVVIPEESIKDTQGREHWFQVVKLPLVGPSGKADRVLGVGADITTLKQFTTQLNTAADISTQVNTVLDPDILLEQVIPLIKERFGLYYVHVYTVDEAEGVLKLRAGYGEPGRVMLERGHSIPLDAEKSLVARAARTKEMVLVDDVRADPEFLPNPLLPDTKSEVAVPMVVGDRVLGVFDVQHDEAAYFTESYLDVFSTLAGQIATAFQNAQVFAERKQAEEAAVREKNLADAVINNLPGIFFMHDTQGRLVRSNRAYQEVFGLSDEEMENVYAIDRFPEDERELIASTMGKIFTAGEQASVEAHLLTKEGETPFNLMAQRLLVGGEAYLLGTGIDIKERKEAEQALLESRERLQALFNAIPDMIFQFDKSGTFLEYKAESGAELVAPPELFLGKQVGAVLPPAIAEVTLEKIKEALKTGETVSYEYQLPVGETLHSYEARMAPSGGDTVTAMVRDITDRKQAEVALRESEARLLQALRIAKMGYWEEDVATQTFIFNDQYYDAIHDTTAEAVGGYKMSSEEFARRFMIPEEGPIVGENFQKALAATDPNYQAQFETRNLTADGEERWVSVWFSIERDAQGNAVRFHGVNQDISERKQAEVERERFATQLSTAAEIATRVNTILDPDELLQAVIPLIKERFGLYYVHTYAVDEAEGVLKLRAGYGEPGRIMVERGHSIPLDAEKSLVARAARMKEVVLVDDVRADPDFLPNPLLPDTKTEVAVPAIVGGKVLGVLDVQHDVAHYFTDSDLDVLRTLNEQIATAFQNANLYAESREVQRRLQTLMTNLPGMAYRMRNEPDWPVEFASEGCLALTGYMPEQLAIGPKNIATYGNLIHPEDRDRVWEETEAGLETTQSYQVTYRIHTAEGELKSVWEQGRGVYSSSGELIAIEGFIADITDRQRAAEAMAEQQAFLDQVINASPDLIFVKDYDSKYVLANRALAGLYGTTPEEMIGKTDVDFSPTETEVEFFQAQDRKVIDTQEEVQIPEESITDTQGREHWFQIVKLPLMGPSGKADRVLGVGADITALKQFTTQLGTAADISTQVNTVLDPDELLQSVIPLIKERFGLYYVHVYTVDEAEGVLKLRAGYGEPGRIMVERGHHISLDAEKSLVARAARTKEMVLVDDVRADPEFLPNPLLPDTKSEVAVPMVVGDRVLGVFDVQHDEAHYFTESYLDVFSTLAGQIATAFQNAQLFAERAQTEVEREAQRVFMRQVIDAVPEFIFVKDREGVFTLANESLAKAYGTTVDMLTGKNESEFIPNAEDAKKFHAADLAVIDSGQDLLIPEETITDASGSVRWLQTTKRPLRGADGKLDQLLGVSVDITEQRQAQANLRTIFNSVYDAVFIHSVDGSILDVNDQLLKVYGVTREQAPTFSIAEDYSSPENPLDELAITWQKTLAGEPQYFEWKARRPNDGTTFDAEVFLRKISMGDRDVVMANVRDVSERKQAEAERERFARQLGVAADISAQVNTILDPDELLQAVIPLIKERFGLYYVHVYTVDEAEGVLKLRAGYGEPGRIMVERGHKIPLDAEKSLVARAARTQEMVLVDDVRQDPEFLPNPLLPNTKSEVAVPAIAGGKVLGVFDVQHDVAAYFTEVDLDVFRTLAGQIATAFQNASLYAASQNERAFYDGIITNLPVGVWAVDQNFTPLLVNPVGKTMMGREIEDQHGGAYVEQYDVVNVATGEHYQESDLPLVKTITQGGKHEATDAALRWPDGTLIPMLINSAPLTDAEGKQTGAVVIFVDMTEQKRAEQAALQEKYFADTVINSLPGIFFMHDTSGKLIRCNKAYQEVFGFSDADLENAYALERFPEEERETILSVMEKIFTGPEQQSVEGHLLTKDGKTPFNLMAQRLIVGDAVYLVGTGTDITDRKRAEKAIQEQQAFLNQVINASPDLIFVKDYDSKYVLANQALASLYGTTPEEMIGKTDADFSPTGTEVAYFQAQDRKVIDTQEEVLIPEESISDTQGREHWFQVVKLPLAGPSGKVDRVLGVGADITKLKQFTTQLSTAADISTQVNTELDPDTLLQSVIPLIKERFGLYYVHVYTVDEAAGVLKLRAGYGEPGRVMLERGHSIPLAREQSLVARAARTKQVVAVDDVRADPEFLPNPLLPDTKSEVAVPMVVGDQVLGVFDVQHDEAHYFTESYLDVFSTLAGQIATALQNAQYFEQVERSLAGTEARLRVSQALTEVQTEEAVLDALIQVAGFHPQAEVSIYTSVEDREDQVVLRRVAAFDSGIETKIPAGTQFAMSDVPLFASLSPDKPFVSNNLVEDEVVDPASRAMAEQVGIASLGIMPIMAGRTPLGFIAISSKVPDAFDDRILYLYQNLAEQGAAALQAARLQDAVKESEERFRVLYENSPLGFILNDFDKGDYIAANNAFLAMMGYTLDELNQLSYWDLTPKKYEADEAEQIRSMNETGRYGPYEKEYIRKGGEAFPVTLNGVVVTDSTGRKLIWSVVENITERRQAEQALHVTRASVDAASDMIYWFDADARFIDVNEATIRMLGYTREELLTMGVFDVDPHFPREAWPGLKEQLRKQTSVNLEGFNRTKDGLLIPVEVIVSYVEFGGQEYYFSLARDITDRRQAEAERQRFTTQLGTAAEVATRANAILDPDELLNAVVALVKERFDLYHAHVYTFEEKTQELVLQAGYGEPGRVMKEQGHKISLDAEQSLVARAARTHELLVVDDVTKEAGFLSNPLLPDTRSEVAVPLMVGDRLLGVFDVQDAHVGRFVAGDLSVLQTLAGQVSTALQNALYFDEIQKTTARLREVDRLKSEFLANMSHELRTPLNSIIGYSEVLMMGIDGDLEPETLEDIKAIYDNGQHLLAMINDILDLAKIEAGRMTLKTEDLDLVLMIEEVKSATMGLFHKKPGVEFQVVIDGELPIIRGDRIRLSQVFINLVSNAEKFTEKGSVKVRAYRQGRHWNCITVEDTGIGIPENEISGLFEKFHQVDGSSKRRAQGTGLGLAISKELVQLHGGRIEVRSKYGEGSSFTVWLPVAE